MHCVVACRSFIITLKRRQLRTVPYGNPSYICLQLDTACWNFEWIKRWERKFQIYFSILPHTRCWFSLLNSRKHHTFPYAAIKSIKTGSVDCLRWNLSFMTWENLTTWSVIEQYCWNLFAVADSSWHFLSVFLTYLWPFSQQPAANTSEWNWPVATKAIQVLSIF